MIYGNSKIVNIYKGDIPIEKVIKGSDLLFNKPNKDDLKPIEKLVFDGYTNRQDLPLEHDTTYKFILDSPNELVWRDGYRQNRKPIDNDTTWHSPSYFQYVYLDQPTNVKIIKIINGGGQ